MVQTSSHYIEKDIKSITEEDLKVSFFGTIVDIEENTIMVDDGNATIKVIFRDKITDDYNKKYVRVFGRVVIIENGVMIDGDILQDMSNLNRKVYRRSKDVLGKMEELVTNEEEIESEGN